MTPTLVDRLSLLCTAASCTLAACGGGGGGDSTTVSSPSASTGTTTALSAVAPGAVSTGSITAFGSVFVNGHEYRTANASVIDDDTGATTASTAALDIGMVVDVKAASTSTTAAPAASELHVHPLARGFVDAIGTSASVQTLTVMAQTVQTTASTSFSDRRACVRATTGPCVAITGLSGLTATTGSGSSAVAGSYVTVDGYLYGSSSTPTAANVVATLVSVADAPAASATGALFKAEGSVTATGASSITIGGLTVTLGSAVCRGSTGAVVSCASAFTVGQVVSAYASATPSLPATVLAASNALSRPNLPVATSGAAVEIEGSVSSAASAAPAHLTVRGITVDASALPSGTALPVVGDVVKVLGTVATSGTSVVATSLTTLRHALSTSYGFEGDVSAIAAGTTAGTYSASVLGQTLNVSAAARLADLSARARGVDPAANPFNITTFQTYLAASSSKHVIVQAYVDASGHLDVVSLAIVPASSVDAVAGLVDASPAPVNGTAGGTPSTFAIHGVTVGADPAAIRSAAHGSSTTATIAAGDEVTVYGAATAAGSGLTVGATPGRSNLVVDFGAPSIAGHGDHSGF